MSENVIAINVFYHPNSSSGELIFEGLLQRLYSELHLDIDSNIKIPILRIPYYKEDRTLPNFDKSEWARYSTNIILVIIDKNLSNDEKAKDSIGELIEYKKHHRNTHIVAFSDDVGVERTSVTQPLLKENIMRPLAMIKGNVLGIPENNDSILSVFCIEFYHFLVKLLVNKRHSAPLEKVTLFLSHTKFGGLEVTTAVKSFIVNIFQLSKFFDVQDIEIGTEFELEIKRWIEKEGVVFVVLLTDNYASRTACKMETLYAKEHFKPIITVNAVHKNEKRSFPYLNNTPVIRWKKTPKRIFRIIELALKEYLRTAIIQEEMEKLMSSVEGIDGYICSHPEVITISNLRKRLGLGEKATIVYPNPVLDALEIELLKQYAPQFKFVTPWQL